MCKTKQRGCPQTTSQVYTPSQWAVWHYGRECKVTMWSNPYSHLSGNDGILGKYTELFDYREQCAVADLHTKVVTALFSCDRLWTKVGWSLSGPEINSLRTALVSHPQVVGHSMGHGSSSSLLSTGTQGKLKILCFRSNFPKLFI